VAGALVTSPLAWRTGLLDREKASPSQTNLESCCFEAYLNTSAIAGCVVLNTEGPVFGLDICCLWSPSPGLLQYPLLAVLASTSVASASSAQRRRRLHESAKRWRCIRLAGAWDW
jgi:hypothetical protein